MTAVTAIAPRPSAIRADTLNSHTQAVERVIQAMRGRLASPPATPLTLGEMAEIACLSPFHFTRVFNAATGLPPGEFSAALRLDAAKRRLLTTSLSVTDICFDLGYTSLGSFGLRFKRLVGLSPLQLRQTVERVSLSALRSRADATDNAAQEWQARQMAGDLVGPLASAGDAPGGGSGIVTAPAGFAGLIFIGLFTRPIPQGRPIACATITTPGAFRLTSVCAPIPDGRYFVYAAALPWSRDPLAYLAPGAEMLVGAGERAISVRAGLAGAPMRVALRARHLSDPPILGIFPSVLATAHA